MEAFLLVGPALFVMGAIVGYFWSGSYTRLSLACVFVSLAVLVCIYVGYSSELGQHALGYYFTALLYWVTPYLGFFLLPCLSGALLVRIIRRRLHRLDQDESRASR